MIDLSTKEMLALGSAMASHDHGKECEAHTVNKLDTGYIQILYRETNPYHSTEYQCITTTELLIAWAWYHPRTMP